MGQVHHFIKMQTWKFASLSLAMSFIFHISNAQGISSNVLHLKIKTSSQISDIPQSLPLPSKFISKEDRLSGLSTKIPTTYSFTQPLHSISASSTRKSYMAKDFLNTSGANVRPSALSSSVSSTHRRTESSPNPTSTLTSTVISLTLHNRNGHFVSSKGTFSLQIPVSSFVKGQTHQALPVTSYQSNNTQKSSGAATISISSQTLKFTPSQNVDSLFSQKAFKIPLKHRSAKTSSFPPRPSAALSIPSFTTSHASPSSSVTKQSSLLFRSDLPELHTSHKAASTSKLALNTGAATLLFKSQPSSKQLTTLLPIKPSFVKESKSETSLSKSISQMLTAEPILTSSSSKTEPQLIRNSVTSRMSQSDSTYLSKLRTAVNQPSLSSLITSERNPSQQISDIARLTSMSLSQSSVPISYDISGAVKALTFITAIGRFKSTHATLPVHSLSAQSFAVSAPTTTNNLPVTNKGTISGIISTKSSTFITSLNPTVTLKSTDGQTTMFIGNSMYLNQSSVFKTSTRSQPATTMASLNPMTAFREVPTTNTMIKQNTGSTHSSKVPVPPLFIFVSRRVNRWNSFTISSSQNFPLPDSMVQSISSSWTTNKIITKVNQLSPPSFTSGIYQPLISFDTLQSKASEATISFASIVGKQRDISFTLVPHNTAEASSTNRAMGSSSSSLQARTISSHFITTTTSTFDPALSTRKPTIRPPQVPNEKVLMGILPTKYMILDGRTLESQDVFTRTVLTSTSSIIYKKVKSKLEAHLLYIFKKMYDNLLLRIEIIEFRFGSIIVYYKATFRSTFQSSEKSVTENFNNSLKTMTRQTFIFNANGLTGAIIPQRIGFEDFDECSSSPCDENAICFNLPFTYECICKSGFHGNGFLCSEKESYITLIVSLAVSMVAILMVTMAVCIFLWKRAKCGLKSLKKLNKIFSLPVLPITEQQQQSQFPSAFHFLQLARLDRRASFLRHSTLC